MSHLKSKLLKDLEEDSAGKKIVLVGNPNTGKSIFFNYLTGLYVEVSNYSGTTVEVFKGKLENDFILDTPGIFSVSSFNDEEKVARDIILKADVIINVVNATSLERDLFLTLQLLDMQIPMIVALNFMDEAMRMGIRIDIDLLSDLLGVPIIPCIAKRNEGLEEVKKAIKLARPGNADAEIKAELKEIIEITNSTPEALLILEGDEFIASKYGISPKPERERIYKKRRARVDDIIGHIVEDEKKIEPIKILLGKVVMNPWTGIPFLALVLFLIYQLVGVLIAQKIVGFTEGVIFGEYFEPLIKKITFYFLSENSVLATILVGEFGILTMTPTYLFGLLLPLVVGFYLSLAILEDTGYLPRLAVMVDRGMNTLGLNGRAVIPMILGLGCVTMATITTRLLATSREKTIAASILNFAVPCSAQLGVIAAMLSRVGLKLTIFYGLVIFLCFIGIGTILNKILPGQSTELLIDIPPMRLPVVSNIIKKTLHRSYFFMKEAFPWFFLGAFIVSLMQISGFLQLWQGMWKPIVVKWLQLPSEVATAFVMGLVRRDFGAAGLYEISLSDKQVVVALIVITLFVPCIASVMVLIKERGIKETIAIWFGAMGLSFLIGGIVSQILI